MQLSRACLLLIFWSATATAFLTPSPANGATSATTKAAAGTARYPLPARIASTRVLSASFSGEENIPPHVREELEAQAKEARTRIESMVKQNQVMLFMKGTKVFPMCGFSNTAVQVLRASEAEFETFDVLSDPAVRDEIKKFSQWPTIPQCFVNGEFIGGSDILLELFESGELQGMLKKSA